MLPVYPDGGKSLQQENCNKRTSENPLKTMRAQAAVLGGGDAAESNLL